MLVEFTPKLMHFRKPHVYLNLPIFLHRYICHICDISQLCSWVASCSSLYHLTAAALWMFGAAMLPPVEPWTLREKHNRNIGIVIVICFACSLFENWNFSRWSKFKSDPLMARPSQWALYKTKTGDLTSFQFVETSFCGVYAIDNDLGGLCISSTETEDCSQFRQIECSLNLSRFNQQICINSDA